MTAEPTPVPVPTTSTAPSAASGPGHAPPAALVVLAGPPTPDVAVRLDRTLTSLASHLPQAPVLVRAARAVPGLDDLVDAHPDVTWLVSDGAVGLAEARTELAARVPDRDLLLLEPGVALSGPLTGARAALARPGTAVVAPRTTSGDRPWDVARRPPTVLRSLAEVAGLAPRWRALRPASDRHVVPPDTVHGRLEGGALLVSRVALDAVGSWGDRFFAHGVDAGWQRAARAAGWTLRLGPAGEQVGDPTLGDPTFGDPAVGAPSGDATTGAERDPDARRRDAAHRAEDLFRADQVRLLGIARNVGPGTGFALGAAVLDRVLPTRRRQRRRDAGAALVRAGGRPAVVITTNRLDLGGAERQRVQLANELAARGHPVTVVCLQWLGLYVNELDPRVRLVAAPFWLPLVDLPGEDAVVVGGVTNTEVAFALAWRALGRVAGQRRRWMPATHDPALLDGPTYSAGLARALRRADGLLVLARQHHVDLTRHQRLTSTVMVAPNGIPAAEALPYRPATAGGPVRFGMLTRLHEYKNPLLLVDALAALDARGLPDWTLDIFGDGPDREGMEARTPGHLLDRVRWRGPSPGPDHAFAEIDVLCVPSGFEAFPLVMVEAMTRGVPVMASVSGAVPEMLDDGRAGVVVQPLTREAWTDALAAVVTDPAATAALGEAGRRRALAHYTVAAMTDDYQRALARVLGRPVPGGPEGAATTLG